MAKKGKDYHQGGQGMLFCSFCGKNQNEVLKLVAGPTAYICDECIELCRCIVEEEAETSQKKIPTRGFLNLKLSRNFLISM